MAILRAVFASAVLLWACPPLTAQAEPVPEYQVKAVFLFNFAQFVEWPAPAFSDARAPLVIGVLGDDPLGAFLEETVRGERLGERALVVRRYRRVEDVTTCHILFISRSERALIDEIRARLEHRPILIVSDIRHFAEQGGMIGFITDKNRVRFAINLEATQAANLTVSSKLLRVAHVVTPAKP